ncbi:hypothetical protein LSAT2_009504 [Lamellibrachia satsuma]|nr:hypothetical protein LSAT2_009504 [Lamellibrachia satsuma]
MVHYSDDNAKQIPTSNARPGNMASNEGFSKISMEQNQETTCADTEMPLDKTTLHNGASNKNVSDTVTYQAMMKRGKQRQKRRERNKEDGGGDKKPPVKEFTELDKYWKVVEDNPSDFTGWTYLLQYVEQERNMETVRKAFDAFFVHYPYCYGYWKKYADLEKEPDKVEQVFEHGVKAVALSIDLWVHYLTFAANKYNSHADKISILRE